LNTNGGGIAVRKLGQVAIVLGAGLALLVLAAGCAPARIDRAPIGSTSDPALDAATREVVIPQDATRTAPAASTTQSGAPDIRTDAPAVFYRVQPHADNWFRIDGKARVIGWGVAPGTQVGVYLVSADGSRTVVDVSGFDQPLVTPGPDVVGNASVRGYFREDKSASGPGWLVLVPRTYDNRPGLVGLELTSGW
jgi:hypothetical protein